ncbi:hypothetical protein AAHC03_01088 [Spirometra sp. Aus1]
MMSFVQLFREKPGDIGLQMFSSGYLRGYKTTLYQKTEVLSNTIGPLLRTKGFCAIKSKQPARLKQVRPESEESGRHDPHNRLYPWRSREIDGSTSSDDASYLTV